MRSNTKVRATNSRKMSADSAAKIRVSSLVSGCRNVRLKVACEKMTPNRRNTEIDRATIAGVRLRFCSGRVGGVTGDITREGYAAPWAHPNSLHQGYSRFQGWG